RCLSIGMATPDGVPECEQCVHFGGDLQKISFGNWMREDNVGPAPLRSDIAVVHREHKLVKPSPNLIGCAAAFRDIARVASFQTQLFGAVDKDAQIDQSPNGWAAQQPKALEENDCRNLYFGVRWQAQRDTAFAARIGSTCRLQERCRATLATALQNSRVGFKIVARHRAEHAAATAAEPR